MKTRKSPKALRKAKLRAREKHEQLQGILTLGKFPFIVAGTLAFSAASDTVISFPNVAFQNGDWISISGQSNDRSKKIDHKKVHIARRRQSKGKIKPVMYEIENAQATTMTIKAGTGLHAGDTITTNGIYTVTCA